MCLLIYFCHWIATVPQNTRSSYLVKMTLDHSGSLLSSKFCVLYGLFQGVLLGEITGCYKDSPPAIRTSRFSDEESCLFCGDRYHIWAPVALTATTQKLAFAILGEQTIYMPLARTEKWLSSCLYSLPCFPERICWTCYLLISLEWNSGRYTWQSDNPSSHQSETWCV